MASRSDFSVTDPVQFRHQGKRVTGHIAKKASEYAWVKARTGEEFKVPWLFLERDRDGQPQRVTTRVDSLKAAFRPNDRVSFPGNSGSVTGTVARLGPKNARVVADGGGEYAVPYALLEPAGPRPADGDERRLAETASQAEQLLSEHGLAEWSFQFDDASRRAGCCDYQTKVISLASQFALAATPAEVRDTILHEIAHALVGPRHNHDSVWKATARSIGCTADRCHSVTFAPSKYIVSCPRCGWHERANRRDRHLVCKTCRGHLRYRTFTESAWKAVQSQQAESGSQQAY